MTRSILHTAVALSLTTSAWAQAPAPATPTNTATPAIAGGKLIIRTAHKLLCVPGSKPQP